MNVNNEAAYSQKNIFLEHVINGLLLDRILFVRYPYSHPLGKKSHIFVVNSKLTEGLSLPLISQKEISKENVARNSGRRLYYLYRKLPGGIQGDLRKMVN